MAQPYVRFSKVDKAYGNLQVVDGISLDIAKGEFLSLLGPSGSGKTTLLMTLAGFEPISGGEIFVDGQPVSRRPPHLRNMGVVFQNYALFPHRTVAENVAFPLRMRGVARAEIATRVDEALDLVQLRPLKDRYPRMLSGGQQQRVALARAMVFRPGLVLMDEPLGALDKQLREQMQLEIRALHHRLGLTIVFVTHDQQEALTMSDRLAILRGGRIEQLGTPREVYHQPQSRFVATFIGETNMLEGQVRNLSNGRAEIGLKSGETLQAPAVPGIGVGDPVGLSLRQECLTVFSTNGHAPDNNLRMTIRDIVFQGDVSRIELATDRGLSLVARAQRLDATVTPGMEVGVGFRASDCRILLQ